MRCAWTRATVSSVTWMGRKSRGSLRSTPIITNKYRLALSQRLQDRPQTHDQYATRRKPAKPKILRLLRLRPRLPARIDLRRLRTRIRMWRRQKTRTACGSCHTKGYTETYVRGYLRCEFSCIILYRRAPYGASKT
jgi:hypothetical protein